jgi:hypothetical protein
MEAERRERARFQAEIEAGVAPNHFIAASGDRMIARDRVI